MITDKDERRFAELSDQLLALILRRVRKDETGLAAAACLQIAVVFHLRNEGLLTEDEGADLDLAQDLVTQTLDAWPRRKR